MSTSLAPFLAHRSASSSPWIPMCPVIHPQQCHFIISFRKRQCCWWRECQLATSRHCDTATEEAHTHYYPQSSEGNLQGRKLVVSVTNPALAGITFFTVLILLFVKVVLLVQWISFYKHCRTAQTVLSSQQITHIGKVKLSSSINNLLNSFLIPLKFYSLI